MGLISLCLLFSKFSFAPRLRQTLQEHGGAFTQVGLLFLLCSQAWREARYVRENPSWCLGTASLFLIRPLHGLLLSPAETLVPFCCLLIGCIFSQQVCCTHLLCTRLCSHPRVCKAPPAQPRFLADSGSLSRNVNEDLSHHSCHSCRPSQLCRSVLWSSQTFTSKTHLP